MGTTVAEAPANPRAGGDSSAEPVAIDLQRLLRIGSVTHDVLDEIRRVGPDPEAVEHLKRLRERTLRELRAVLPKALYAELRRLSPPTTTDSLEELSLAQAEVLGWLQGLLQGAELAVQTATAEAVHDWMRAERELKTAKAAGPAQTPYL